MTDSEAGTGARSVLLIEDEEAHAELVRRSFEENGSEWKFHHVASIEDAFKRLDENEPPSIILSDYLLPDGNGLDLAKAANSPEAMGIPLIILTSQGSERLAVRLLKSGAMDYVVKSAEGIRELPRTAKRVLREWENISQRKRAEDALRESEKRYQRLAKDLEAKNAEMEKFTYTVSHDLRSPLVTIRGFLDLLQEYIERDEKENVELALKMIGEAAIKMDNLLTDTLNLSRIGRMVNPPEDVSFGELVQEALEQTAGEIESNIIEVSVAEDFPVVHVDRVRIAEVLVNLIENSTNYMGEQPRPKIDVGHRLDLDSNENVFFVCDNGIGIDPSQHEEVFELFFRGNRNSKGSGAGLTIVKRIIEVHGGRVWIESEKGKGCTVCFTLPPEEEKK